MEEIIIKFKYFISIILTISIILIILILNMLSINPYSTQIKSEDVVKIGIYEYEPYVYIEENGEIRGYYYEFLNLLLKKYDFEYEYIVCNISDGLEKLENADIDIMLGLPISIMKSKGIIFNNKSISQEEFGVFSTKNISINDLKSNNELTLGLVEADYNAEWILKFFEVSNINIKIVYGENYKILEELMEEDKIDLMVDNAYKKSPYKMLYKFAGEQIYIGGNKNSSDILENIDKVIEEYTSQKYNPLEKLQDKYFDEDYNKKLIGRLILSIILIILFLIVIIKLIIPKIKKRKIKNKIKYRMNRDKYLLQYQPIYNPRNKDIVGFEGLLRLIDEDNKIIPPYKFIPEIEENDMLFDISLWIIKKVIRDYDKIKNYQCVSGKEFYISLNLSLNEIENEAFVKKAIQILYKSNLEPNKICLEIIERVKMNDLDKINKNIDLLKGAGFKIAIDDFGVEYSNLDVLQKLDIDIIKIDKNFVDGIGKDIIRNEIVLFISKIARNTNKYVVLEGVEEIEQDSAIKKIENDLLYVQGYYYNKPMYIEDIEKL
ncbi:EAL domain-containing protein [Clostridium saudiense]|uniref:EAL domain-containing protein n=1 Tax=Clostridium saudiense TaxID=1414720 RepID=A0ABS2FGD1_9CLOT|nr:EAL domain-containing protein [Clostridium saudiense]MBM6819391.1 EAL domain-containing protein [Clostridium saudiense]